MYLWADQMRRKYLLCTDLWMRHYLSHARLRQSRVWVRGKWWFATTGAQSQPACQPKCLHTWAHKHRAWCVGGQVRHGVVWKALLNTTRLRGMMGDLHQPPSGPRQGFIVSPGLSRLSGYSPSHIVGNEVKPSHPQIWVYSSQIRGGFLFLMKSEIILLRCEKKDLLIKIGIVWNR